MCLCSRMAVDFLNFFEPRQVEARESNAAVSVPIELGNNNLQMIERQVVRVVKARVSA
jgi:hypothetical protein